MAKIKRKHYLGFLSVIVFVIIWYLFSLSVNNQFILPSPIKVIESLFNLLLEIKTYEIIGYTLIRLIIAFALSGVLAIILGIISGNYKVIDEILHPFIVTLRTLPVASVIVIILIIFGNELSLFIITFVMVFPIIYEGAKHGVLNISEELKNTITMETNHKLEIMAKLHFPLALPYIKTSLLQSFGLGFKVIVMAEFISQTSKGIGNELFQGSISIEYEKVFAWTIILIVLVTIVEVIVKSINAKVNKKV